MLVYSALLLFLVATVHGADHDIFKDCSRVPFCSTFRGQTLESSAQFAADLSEIQQIDNTAVLSLNNANGEELTLQVSLLENYRARVKVLEANSNRYELSDVLDGKPVVVPFQLTVKRNFLKLTPKSADAGEFSVVITSGTPFTLQFYYKDQLQVVLNGDRLVMENTDNSQAFAFGVEFENAINLFGLFHHASQLTLPETADGSSDPFRLRNSDTTSYELDSPMALYGSIPVIYGHSADWTSGVFLHNAAEQWVDISYSQERPTSYFMVESSTLDLFVLLGPTLKETVRQYTSLTGVAPLPQLWTLGYQQGRDTYENQEEVNNVVVMMDGTNFTMDAIWLGDGYSDGNRYFQWNTANFTDPLELQTSLASTGRKLVVVVDPHIKVDDNYFVYTGAENYFVKWANGSDYQGESLAGVSSWIDFLNPDASDYYASLYSYETFKSSTEVLAGIYNDMNEPSVLDDSLERTLPFETTHYGNVLHRDIHNIYGFLQTKATYQGLLQRDNSTKRPFVLTRSHFAGSQRYAAVTTGGNTADWSYLALSYSECLSANLLGIVFCGADVAGYYNTPSEQLIQRWYQAAIWLPFFRGYSYKDTEKHEPYVYNPEIQIVIRTSFDLRYKHIPVWYTLFFEHTRFGDPIVRPLFYDYPELLNHDDHILIGTDIMARPVFTQSVNAVSVTFPGNETTYWYRADDNSWTTYTGGTTVLLDASLELWAAAPLFYRAGSIIPRKETHRISTVQMVNDPHTLYINLDENNEASGRIYVDDFTSFEYVNSKNYLYIKFTYSEITQEVHFSVIDGTAEGINFTIQSLIINQKSTTSTNMDVIKREYTTTADGSPLNTIDIVKQLRMRSELTIHI